jgi:hypothetical protein
MLRVIRTELYFNPLEIRWQFPERVINNPGISAAFFRCDPKSFDFEKVTLTVPKVVGQTEVRAFLDTGLQNAPSLAHRELNTNIIDKIYNSEIIVEHSPPEGIPFGKLLTASTSVVTIGTYIGSNDLLLFLKVSLGIIVMGGAVVIVRAFDKGLTHVMERAIGSKDKTAPRSTTRRK